MLTLLVYGRLMGMVITVMEMDYSHQSAPAIPIQIVGLPDAEASSWTAYVISTLCAVIKVHPCTEWKPGRAGERMF